MGFVKHRNLYYLDNGTLMRYVQDGKQTYEVTILPHSSTSEVLRHAHHELGHNESTRTYMMIKRVYYWKGLK